jgi:hypothetical protein
VRLSSRGAEDVFDGNAARDQGIRNQRAVAAPGHGLGAHEHGAFLADALQQFLKTQLNV